MLLAVLHRHAGIATWEQDVFVNAVGGVRIGEPAADLAVCSGRCVELADRPIPSKVLAFGEVGLAGEVRPAARGQERLETAKLGFERAIVPKANLPKVKIAGLETLPLSVSTRRSGCYESSDATSCAARTLRTAASSVGG